jgi:hypothetical protein
LKYSSEQFLIHNYILYMYIENHAYASNFITTSQEEKVTNEITGFSTIV